MEGALFLVKIHAEECPAGSIHANILGLGDCQIQRFGFTIGKGCGFSGRFLMGKAIGKAVGFPTRFSMGKAVGLAKGKA